MAKNLKTSVQLDTRKAVRNLDALEKKIRDVQRAINNQAAVTNKLNTATNKLAATNNKVAQSSHKATAAHNKQGKSIAMLTTKVHRLANAYLGVLGAKAALTASDTITSAENRLNKVNADQAVASGGVGYNKDGSYANNVLNKTQSDMNKMYTSAQKVRMGYGAMMQNVSKSITLAGDAFDDNMDNAIRFQEIMAEAYTLGGASQAEQHSSMYQMIQGLGSGILQGDELRSVREGAPLAYKAIEEFAQGIFGAEENLKDLASQGKITSDIVVAAIMAAGEDMDKSFKNTQMTFEQAWLRIKNTALKSFEPVLQMLNDALNSTAGQAIINGIGTAIQFVANTLQVVFKIIGAIYNFIVDNWETIKNILLTIATIYLAKIAFTLTHVVASAIGWLIINVGMLAKRFAFLTSVAVTGALKAAVAWLAANWVLLLIIGVIAAVVIAIVWLSDSFVDACGNIAGAIWVVVSFITTLFTSLVNFFKAVGTNIGIALRNPMEAGKAAFLDYVAFCLEKIKWLEPAFNAIAKLFGGEGFTLSGVIGNIRATSNATKDKLNYVDTKAAFSDTWSDWSVKGAFNEGHTWGAEKGQWISDELGGAKDWLADKLNLTGITDEFINPTDVDSLVNGVNGIGDNTGSMADAMELTAEDLEYLRKVADMEWKKEFTTATIQVDMSNYNTVNGDSDLDGIVTKLTDKLYEELNSVANGVYA